MYKYFYLFTFYFFLCCSVAFAAYRAPVLGRDGMAATPHPAATEAAVRIMAEGGNAVDGAVATAFALSVVEPYHSGLGGGEFAVVWMAKTGESIALDARECAPAASTPDMFIDPGTGRPYPDRSRRGGLAVGVPGSVAGRAALIERFGVKSLAEVIQPSIELARKGFPLDRIFAERLHSKQDALAEDAAAARIFFRDGRPLQRGEILTQPALAKTLITIAKDGWRSFYEGKQAEAIAGACQESGGIMTLDDLASYRVVWRDPVRFGYRGLEILSMPPPSSGGVCLAEILNILEGFPLGFLGPGSAETYHLLASAFEPAFADRARWLGDPDFSPQPVAGLTSNGYAEELREKIDHHRRTTVKGPGDPWEFESGGNTSHISVIDSDGNMCALTTSVNTAFGSLVFVPELGIFLNSTMDDFALAPSQPNEWELVGGDVNAVATGKRPLSSMSPTLVLKEGMPYMAVGSVGGPRIITSVAQIIVSVVDFDMDIQAAVDAPRIHMQWRPDKLWVEEEVSPEVVTSLAGRGWTVEHGGHWSISQAVMIDQATGDFYGASDARGVGTAAAVTTR